MLKSRIRKLNTQPGQNGSVLYWMDRERRANHNWALIASQMTALEYNQALHCIYVIPDQFLNANKRTYTFMLEGLKETKFLLSQKNIDLQIILGDPVQELQKYISENKISTLFTDFSPLKLPRRWREDLTKNLQIPFYEVDTRNIIPCWVTSPKEEFAARTIRPKIHKNLDSFLDKFPSLQTHKFNSSFKYEELNIENTLKSLKLKNIPPSNKFKGGETEAEKVLQNFLENIKGYSTLRNDPNYDATSDLSPYLHYGQISSQYIALSCYDIKAMRPDLSEDLDSFLEEMIVRRELADNYCFYNKDYDNFNGFKDWAKLTLNEHRKDKREYIYSLQEFEDANTHDPLWNAAQVQLNTEGKMHGYMRMYWCKKILEWTETPEKAQEIAIYLNDTYELDGRDPNGYVGIAWSIGGVHDRAWTEREVYGKIRYMNFNGAKRKFDVNSYINKYISTQTTLV